MIRRLGPACLAALALAACSPLADLGSDLGAQLGLDPSPLALSDPLGPSTRGKLLRETRDPEACRAWLTAQGVTFTPMADRDEGEFCSVRNAGALGDGLGGGSSVRLSPARPMMTCQLAAAVAVWRAQSVEPAAREMLGAGVSGLDHFGVYACRRVNNTTDGRPSAHAQAAAIDIRAFRLTNGRRVSVEQDWAGDDAEARFLRRVRGDACRIFGTVLSPDYTAAHANHLHLEGEGGRLCG